MNVLPKSKKQKGTIMTGLVIVLATALFFSVGTKRGKPENTSIQGDGMEHLTLDSFKAKICECGIGEKTENAVWKFKGTVPAVIDFYADWCGPCKMVSPILEELSKEYGDRLTIYKINTESEQELAGMFGITSIPSILFIPVEGQPQMSAGAMPKGQLKKMFREILGVEETVRAKETPVR